MILRPDLSPKLGQFNTPSWRALVEVREEFRHNYRERQQPTKHSGQLEAPGAIADLHIATFSGGHPGRWARVQYFTASQEDLLGEIAQDLVLSGKQKEKSPADHRSESKSRTGVRLAFNLVDPVGVEPTSENSSVSDLHA